MFRITKPRTKRDERQHVRRKNISHKTEKGDLKHNKSYFFLRLQKRIAPAAHPKPKYDHV
jgi:hypothetical protein